MLSMYSQGTQCETESRNTRSQLGRKHWRENVHRSNVHVKGNRYLLTVQDRFSHFSSAYPFLNKEANTVTRTQVGEHFAVHSDNG